MTISNLEDPAVFLAEMRKIETEEVQPHQLAGHILDAAANANPIDIILKMKFAALALPAIQEANRALMLTAAQMLSNYEVNMRRAMTVIAQYEQLANIQQGKLEC